MLLSRHYWSCVITFATQYTYNSDYDYKQSQNQYIYGWCIVGETVLYKAPDRLRLPLVFYYAHTAVVYMNKLMLAGLIQVNHMYLSHPVMLPLSIFYHRAAPSVS